MQTRPWWGLWCGVAESAFGASVELGGRDIVGGFNTKLTSRNFHSRQFLLFAQPARLNINAAVTSSLSPEDVYRFVSSSKSKVSKVLRFLTNCPTTRDMAIMLQLF